MNRILILLSLVISTTTALLANGNTTVSSTKDDNNSKETVMTVGPEQVSLGEFESIFKKNNTENKITKEYLDEYTELFIDFKRKVLYAKENQMDTSATFKRELAGYRTQLARPYLTDQSAEDELVNEAYDRMKYEVRASHILLALDKNATPEDTLKVYNRMKELRNSILKGQSFESIAKANSEDPSAKTNGGDLGYFSAFRMVYPFESVAFNTPVGQVSKPFRTQFGYHILKVIDKRANRGEVKVAHIMIEEKEDATTEEMKANQEKLSQLLESLNNGTSFEEMTKFSDDKGSAKKRGELPWFGAGQMVPEFENAAFDLQNNGDISKPIKTVYGWHLIKRLDKRGIPSFEEAEADIKRNIKRDARSNKGVESLIARIKEEYHFSERTTANALASNHDFYTPRLNLLELNFKNYSNNLEPFCKINYRKWNRKTYTTQGKTMFTLDGKAYTQDDFADYLAENKITADSANTCPMVKKRYEEWVNKTCLEYEDSQLENKYPEFKALMKEYHDGIMLFDLMDQKVWSKAINDTVGLLNYYNLTKDNYRWDERAISKVYTSTNEATANRVRTLINNRYSSSVLSDEEKNFIGFGKGEFYLSDARILKLMNRYKPNTLSISNKTFEKGKSTAVDNHWYNGLTENENNLDGSVFFADVSEVKSGGLKTYDEAKGEVITNYQNYLEAIWKLELEEKYPAKVNKEVLYSIID
jgi:peptidyl-prolyl cis-trans isomerase SurA